MLKSQLNFRLSDDFLKTKFCARFMSQKNQRWILASGNKGKLKEFERLLEAFSVDVAPQSIFSIVEAEETGLSFIENAILKARNAAAQTGLAALADDSGLEVTALNGAPGIYSARYSKDIAGDNYNDSSNNKKLLKSLKDSSQRAARFVCALVFMRHELDPTPIVCVAYWQGKILDAPSGEDGFGYDPLFFIESEACTAAELDPLRKNEISHRGQAMKLLKEQLIIQGVIS